MIERVTFEGSPITLEDVRGFVQYKVDELFDLEPDGATCSRVVMYLDAEIKLMKAKKEQP